LHIERTDRVHGAIVAATCRRNDCWDRRGKQFHQRLHHVTLMSNSECDSVFNYIGENIV